MDISVFSILTALILVFIGATTLSWSSPELNYLNQTDTGPFNGTLTSTEASWITGILLFGCGSGTFIFGPLADKIGRKFTFLTLAVPIMISYFLIAFAKTVPELIVARLLAGFVVGAGFTMIPIYIAEISMDQHRAKLLSFVNCFTNFGILFSYVVGHFIRKVLIYNALLGGITVLFFIVFLLVGAESPHYYIKKNRINLAKKALQKIRTGATDEDKIEIELEMMIRSHIENKTDNKQGSFLDIFKSRGTIKAFIMGSGLIFFQEMSGINAVVFFAQTIFQKAGTTLHPAYCSMIIGGVQFSSSLLLPSVAHRAGRRTLLMISSIGTALSHILLGTYGILNEHNNPSDLIDVSSLTFLPIIALVCFIIAYNIGLGCLPSAIIAEIFPNSVKFRASALLIVLSSSTSFLITTYFIKAAELIGQGECFIIFSVFCILSGIFTYFFVLETKGKSLIEIQENLNN